MIEVRGLTKKYGDNTVVNGISFVIESGKIYGFLGPNGAGKSTTMNMITGCLAPTDGEILVDGISIFDDPIGVKRKVGYLPENPPVYPDMTPEEYLTFVASAKGLRGRELNEQVISVMDETNILPMKDRLIKNLSKGYRQRVGIAQAMLGDPQVIILDEPTVGLDPKQIIEIRNLIRTLGKDHTVILSTHILQEVQAVCDRIIIINKGKVVADELTENINRAVDGSRRFRATIAGPQRDVLNMLKNRPDISYAEMLDARDGDAYTYMIEAARGVDMRKGLFHALAERGWPLMGLEGMGMSLEDVFISIVDGSEAAPKKAKGNRRQATHDGREMERDIAQSILDATAEQQKSIAPYQGDED